MNQISALAIAALFAGTAAAAPAHAAMSPKDSVGGDGTRDTKALNMLEAQGYTDFSNFRPDGKNFAADVTQGGKSRAVTIDPDSGTITPQT